MTLSTEPQIITTNEDLQTLCQHLATQSRLAVDLEGDSLHHFKEKLCLLQVSDANQDYIVDVLSITDFSPMKALFEDASILKVMHGADYDVVSLKRDYNCSINSLFDTGIGAQFLNYEKFGLADLIQKHFGVRLEKRYQKHDWSRRPLYWEHIDYARMDTHYLLAIHEIMELQLKKLGLLEACLEESTCLTQRDWNGRLFDGLDYTRVKKAYALSEASLKVLRLLFETRDAWAEQRDVPVFHYAPDAVLTALAKDLPTTKAEVLNAVHDKHRGVVSKKWKELVDLVQKGLEDERPVSKVTKGSTKRSRSKWLNEVVNHLRTWRTEQQELGTHDFLLPTNNEIRDLAYDLPKNMEELAASGILRQWQMDLWGADVLLVIEALLAGKDAKRKKK